MKKRILLLLCLILITGCYQHNPKVEKDNYTNINYYKEEYQDRYLQYQTKHPELSLTDIITRVNIGLDQPYYTNTKETPFLNQTHILSNKYLYMPETYIPHNLEKIDPTYTNGTKLLVKEAKENFEQLARDAKNQGYTIRAISAYRSYDYQTILYNKYVDQDGKEKADTYSARPGYSEHQTGLVVDVDNGITTYTKFETTKEFNWMQENAHKYGFILRYPNGKEEITGYTYESWHYRYVGKKIAEKIQTQNITFDEYYIRYLEKK
ncbi:MAG: M15 family metallopeptidase [bacterium]|nr:M15 family metallopeptidase [bacterium]